MAEHVEEFTDGNFDEKVLKSDKLTLVDFWAEWCGPCKMIAPVIAELAGEFADKVNIGKLDVDANPKSAGAYGVRSIPTLLFFKDGNIVTQVVGVRPKADLEEIINNNL